MTTIKCSWCNEQMQVEEEKRPRLCPFCGKPFEEIEDPLAPWPLDEALKKESNPKKKYKMIQEALAASPDDFGANRALLFHGRLHESLAMRDGRLDYSIIKCHLFCVFDKPETYSGDMLAEKIQELINGEQLQKTMSLVHEPALFRVAYLRRLASEYIDLFLRSDPRYSQVTFGFPRSSDSIARKCAGAVIRMLGNIHESGLLDDASRNILLHAVYDGYMQIFPGEVHANNLEEGKRFFG
jgi:hypothetical protein